MKSKEEMTARVLELLNKPHTPDAHTIINPIHETARQVMEVLYPAEIEKKHVSM